MTAPRLPRLEPLHFLAVADERGDDALGALPCRSPEIRSRRRVSRSGEPEVFGGRFAGTGPGLARLGALALHRLVEAFRVDADAARAQRVLRQIEREAVGVVKLEGGFAGQLAPSCEIARLLVEDARGRARACGGSASLRGAAFR